MSGDHRRPVESGAARGGEPDVVRIHEPIYRELAEPRDGHEPTPTWLIFLAMALLGWGGYYLGTYSGDFRADVYTEQIAPAVVRGPAQPAGPVDPMVLGRRVYNNCMPCHQADGGGVAGTYPPLAGSEWVTGPAEALAAIVLHGLEGEVVVGGASYDNAMPAWERLGDEQVAAVLTYVRRSFGNDAAAVAPPLVAMVREATEGRRRPWRVAELEELGGGTTAPPGVGSVGR